MKLVRLVLSAFFLLAALSSAESAPSNPSVDRLFTELTFAGASVTLGSGLNYRLVDRFVGHLIDSDYQPPAHYKPQRIFVGVDLFNPTRFQILGDRRTTENIVRDRIVQKLQDLARRGYNQLYIGIGPEHDYQLVNKMLLHMGTAVSEKEFSARYAFLKKTIQDFAVQNDHINISILDFDSLKDPGDGRFGSLSDSTKTYSASDLVRPATQHPNERGQALALNLFIREFNRHNGTAVPLINESAPVSLSTPVRPICSCSSDEPKDSSCTLALDSQNQVSVQWDGPVILVSNNSSGKTSVRSHPSGSGLKLAVHPKKKIEWLRSEDCQEVHDATEDANRGSGTPAFRVRAVGFPNYPSHRYPDIPFIKKWGANMHLVILPRSFQERIGKSGVNWTNLRDECGTGTICNLTLPGDHSDHRGTCEFDHDRPSLMCYSDLRAFAPDVAENDGLLFVLYRGVGGGEEKRVATFDLSNSDLKPGTLIVYGDPKKALLALEVLQ